MEEVRYNYYEGRFIIPNFCVTVFLEALHNTTVHIFLGFPIFHTFALQAVGQYCFFVPYTGAS
jgi:hypothetical protein